MQGCFACTRFTGFILNQRVISQHAHVLRILCLASLYARYCACTSFGFHIVSRAAALVGRDRLQTLLEHLEKTVRKYLALFVHLAFGVLFGDLGEGLEVGYVLRGSYQHVP